MTSRTLPKTSDERLVEAGLLKRLLTRPELGALGGAILVWIIFAVIAGNRGFLTLQGTASYLEVSSYLGILAVAIALLMIGGEFDLSIGSMIGAAGATIAVLGSVFGVPLWLASLIALGVALLVGFINGVMVIRTKLPSFIITLGSLFILRGLTIALTRIFTGRTQVGSLDQLEGYEVLRLLFGGSIPIGGANFPVSIVWWLAITAVATWVLMRTRFGNWIFSAGGNAEAARNVGVPVSRVKVTLFMATAAAAWLVATIQLTVVKSADTLRGTQQEFIAIIAAVIGGNLLTGGYGSAVGAALGALIFGMVRQGIVYAGIDADWFQVFLGAMLIVAVLVNNFIRDRAEKARR
ncbi:MULTISPECIES: ABC transporter permease [Caldilinea]|jgi:simple sugar transport system permease protein|uniref:Xylose transport system permease protein XylH n=1 Tax=Caldilinea aerophila (strain DSM 14535 / JCM 11387 / NBRC 104270 / STL-6-O1) TaxID=926550 RepID=I0I5V9_CALAS|nr:MULTISPECIES: ABC transporter permease [Caldilinea]BAM00647.1 putative ABC transporter permease protein [Caldilinea aerophila DSM 14535 = NBRC 104270]GIV67924.1 MAG: sugar ABC transporter permease [Caldilinea sp.]